MAKRGYKIQELVAHPSNVNCLSIAKKTCRLFVTGGDDCKINLWSIGKPKQLMSLCGHTSPVESLAFEPDEIRLLGGASAGAIKLWDLEESKLVRSVNGHRANCTAVEFHPFGELFASGSSDTNIKIWDIRRKSCIHTYKGHTDGISTIKFSPDGRWIVTGGLDNSVKVWDLTAGKLLNDFKVHEGPISSIKFHPREFLLATGSADRTVKFWDLETFELIGSTKPEETCVRSISFNHDGKTLFCGSDSGLKVFSWEPIFCHDTIQLGWSTVGDLCVDERKLVGCSYYRNSVGVWVADISLIKPYGSDASLQEIDHEKAKDKSVIHSAKIKEASTVLSSTSEKREDVKNIYIDCTNGRPLSSRSEDLLGSREIALDKADMHESTLDKIDICGSISKKAYNSSGLLSTEPPASKDVANSRRETIAFTRTKPGMLLRPASVRKPSNKSKSSEKCSQDLDTGVHVSDDLAATSLIQLKRCSEDVMLASHHIPNKSVENSSRLSSITSFGLSSVEPAYCDRKRVEFEIQERIETVKVISDSGHRSSADPAPQPKRNEFEKVPDRTESVKVISNSGRRGSPDEAPVPKGNEHVMVSERSEPVQVISNSGHFSSPEAAPDLKRNESEMVSNRAESCKVISRFGHINSEVQAPTPKCDEIKTFHVRQEPVKVISSSERLSSVKPAPNKLKCSESKKFQERSESIKFSSNVENLSFAEPATNDQKRNKFEMFQERNKSVKENSECEVFSFAESVPDKPKCDESKLFQERTESGKFSSNFGQLSTSEPARNKFNCNESELVQERSASVQVINTVTVVTGRTRSLVEKFERQEKLCGEDQINAAPPFDIITSAPAEVSQMLDPQDSNSTHSHSVSDLNVTPAIALAQSSETKKEPLLEDQAPVIDPIQSLIVPSENLAPGSLTCLDESNSFSTEAFAGGETMGIEDQLSTVSSVSIEELSIEDRPNTPQNNALNVGKGNYEGQPLAAPSNVIKLAPKSSKNASKPRFVSKSSTSANTRNVISTKAPSPGNASTSTPLLIPRTTTTRETKPTARMRSFAYGREINQRRIPPLSSTMEWPTVGEADDMSSAVVDISKLLQSHDELLNTLKLRLTRLQVIRQFWDRNDLRGAIDALSKLLDQSVQADVVSLLTDKMQILTLECFSSMLPVLVGLLDSTVDRHASVSMDLLLKLVAAFGPVIRSTISARPTVGIDIQAQERRECCNICHEHLQKVQQLLPSLSRRSGILAKSALEFSFLFQQS